MGKMGAPNAGIVCTRLGCVVIDPMLNPALGDALNVQAQAKERVFWENLYALRKEQKRTLAPPVLYVFNTTFRANHTFGNQAFDRLADIISTTKAKDRLEIDGAAMRAELRDEWKVPSLEGHATTSATITLDEGAFNLDTPDIKIKFVAMGDCVGEGDAVVYLPVQKVLFAGDMVIPGYVPYYKGRSPTVRNWIEALKLLEKWNIETVVPGHGDLARKDAITQQREFLEALVNETAQAIKAGKDIEQAAQSVKLPLYARWSRYDEWLPENVKLVYRELKGSVAVAGKSGEAGGGAVRPAALERPDGFRDK
jgi:glyoxylase-like metal-dependent hydrolase (beta-lactamase superfamily II)